MKMFMTNVLRLGTRVVPEDPRPTADELRATLRQVIRMSLELSLESVAKDLGSEPALSPEEP